MQKRLGIEAVVSLNWFANKISVTSYLQQRQMIKLLIKSLNGQHPPLFPVLQILLKHIWRTRVSNVMPQWAVKMLAFFLPIVCVYKRDVRCYGV